MLKGIKPGDGPWGPVEKFSLVVDTRAGMRACTLRWRSLCFPSGVGSRADLTSEQMHEQNLRIQLGLERMVRLNQTLTRYMTLAGERLALHDAKHKGRNCLVLASQA